MILALPLSVFSLSLHDSLWWSHKVAAHSDQCITPCSIFLSPKHLVISFSNLIACRFIPKPVTSKESWLKQLKSLCLEQGISSGFPKFYGRCEVVEGRIVQREMGVILQIKRGGNGCTIDSQHHPLY